MSANRDASLTASEEEIERVKVCTVGVFLEGSCDLHRYLTLRNEKHAMRFWSAHFTVKYLREASSAHRQRPL